MPGVTPDLETVITVSPTTFQFADDVSAADGPSLLEIVADGEARIELFAAPGDVRTKVPTGFAPWWTGQPAVGNEYLTVYANLPRQLDVRGTGAYEMVVTFVGGTTRVTVSASKER